MPRGYGYYKHPLYCPKCKHEHLIKDKNLKVKVIKELMNVRNRNSSALFLRNFKKPLDNLTVVRYNISNNR